MTWFEIHAFFATPVIALLIGVFMAYITDPKHPSNKWI